MKKGVLRTILTTALASTFIVGGAVSAFGKGPVLIPEDGQIVVVNHNPNITFASNVTWDVAAQTTNTLKTIGFKGSIHPEPTNANSNDAVSQAVNAAVVVAQAKEFKEFHIDVPNILFEASYNKDGASATVLPATTVVFTSATPEVPAELEKTLVPNSTEKWSVKTLSTYKDKSQNVQLAGIGEPKGELNRQGLLITKTFIKGAVEPSTVLQGENSYMKLYFDAPKTAKLVADSSAPSDVKETMPTLLKDGKGTTLMVTMMKLNDEAKAAMAGNPNNINRIVFAQGMNIAKNIGNTAKSSHVYTYMKDHYLNLIIVAKDFESDGKQGNGVMMVSKQDNFDDMLMMLYSAPKLSESNLEQVISSMLSTHIERK